MPCIVHRAAGIEVLAVPAAERIAADERDERDCGREGEQGTDPSPGKALLVVAGRLGVRLEERRRQLGRRPGEDEHLVHALEPGALLLVHVVADQLAEVRGLSHPSSSRRSARRERAARVRVLTVPSGMSRNSATSDWESPLQ